MQFINHPLSALSLSVGFLLFYKLNFKKTIAIGMIFFLVGLGIGMHEHLNQDSVYYDKTMYMDRVVYLKEYESMPMSTALCIMFSNDDNDNCREETT